MNNLCPLDTCISLKNIGFREPTLTVYEKTFGNAYVQISLEYSKISNDTYNYVSCPTFEEAFDWFDKTHNYVASIKSFSVDLYTYTIQVRLDQIYMITDSVQYSSNKEEIKTICLKHLISLVN